jgi:protein-tyrosine phosphatase
MVDIHSHILPGLDDGSPNIKTSLEMLRIAAASGTTDIVATPHANLDYAFDPAVVGRKLEQLSAKAGPAPRIHRGCDLHLSFDNIEDALAHPTKYTINGHRYLLVEFSDLIIFKNVTEIFDRLLQAGMVPIITHPERNWLLQQRLGDLELWVRRGVLLQVTALSLTGRFGRAARTFSEKLIELGLAHFIASDAHDPVDRTPSMAEAFRRVARRYGDTWAERLFVTNPRCTLTGEPLNLGPHADPPRPRRWFHMFRKGNGEPGAA